MCGSGLKWDGRGLSAVLPCNLFSMHFQKRCAAIVTSLSASNELHMIVCIQMFFVQKNFRLPDCIHCRRTLCGALSLSRVSIYRLLYMFVCIVNLLSCFSSLAVCLFSLASIPYTYLYVIPMPPCTCLYALRSFSFFPCRAVHCFISSFCRIFLIRSVGRERGAKSDTDPSR